MEISLVSLKALARLVYNFEGLHQRPLDIFDPEGAVRNVVRTVEWIQNYEGILKWTKLLVFAKLYLVSIQIVQVRLETYTVEMEKAREVPTQRLLLFGVESFQISRDHEHKGVRRKATVVRHAEESLIENLFDDHDDGAQVLAVQNQLLDVVNGVDATVRLPVGVVVLEVLLRLLVNTDVYFQVPHLFVDLLLAQTESLNVDVVSARPLLVVGGYLLLFFSVSLELFDGLFNLDKVDHLQVDNKFHDRDRCTLNELDLVYLAFVFQEFQVVEQLLHHFQVLIFAPIRLSAVTCLLMLAS